MASDLVRKYIELIDDMRDDMQYEFAEDTLKSFRDFYNKNKSLSEKQMSAVDNILNSKPWSETFREWEG